MRRLPPGMTEEEFWSILGEEWQVGKGRVDWASYSEGKVSKEYVKAQGPGVRETDMHPQPFEAGATKQSISPC